MRRGRLGTEGMRLTVLIVQVNLALKTHRIAFNVNENLTELFTHIHHELLVRHYIKIKNYIHL